MSAGKNKQGVRTKNGDTSKGISDMEIRVKERKLYLQKEYKILTEHMNTYMGRMEHFLQENKFLEKEAKRNQEESNAYLSYIRKHSQKCQNLIITLNDQNHTDLSEVWMQKEKLISQYTEKEEEVRSALMNMETKYSLMNKEVEDLQPFKYPSLQHTMQTLKPTALTAHSDASINLKKHLSPPHSCQCITRHSWTVSCCQY
uniref:Coiled-coil domain-containing protein 166 n=1 Tax=Bubo bubo TaxID=30461 RepID=A0A8C0EK95_BUBBB